MVKSVIDARGPLVQMANLEQLDNAADLLKKESWDILIKFHEITDPIRLAILKLESNTASLSDVPDSLNLAMALLYEDSDMSSCFSVHLDEYIIWFHISIPTYANEPFLHIFYLYLNRQRLLLKTGENS